MLLRITEFDCLLKILEYIARSSICVWCMIRRLKVILIRAFFFYITFFPECTIVRKANTYKYFINIYIFVTKHVLLLLINYIHIYVNLTSHNAVTVY